MKLLKSSDEFSKRVSSLNSILYIIESSQYELEKAVFLNKSTKYYFPSSNLESELLITTDPFLFYRKTNLINLLSYDIKSLNQRYAFTPHWTNGKNEAEYKDIKFKDIDLEFCGLENTIIHCNHYPAIKSVPFILLGIKQFILDDDFPEHSIHKKFIKFNRLDFYSINKNCKFSVDVRFNATNFLKKIKEFSAKPSNDAMITI